MKKYLLIGSVILSQTLNLKAFENEKLALLDAPLEKLKTIEVYTANREFTKIEEAASVVTLITSKDIQKHGYKTLADVLERVSGFYIGRHGGLELIGNRGFIQDQNTNYLLLVDGHKMNHSNRHGIGSIQLFPMLADIDRIEIIRGPGSTLWGSSALMGIIHIYTKSASELNGVEAGLNYDIEDKRYGASILYGKRFENGRLMTSLQVSDSDAPWYNIYQPSTNAPELKTSKVNNHFDFQPSYNLYLKGNWNNFYIQARHSSLRMGDSINMPPTNYKYIDWVTSYIDLAYKKELSAFLKVEAKVFFDDQSSNVVKPDSANIISGSNNYGGEIITTYALSDNFHIISGINYEKYNPKKGDIKYQDNQMESIFSELNYGEIENWNFVVGARLDRSDRLAKGTEFMPRVSIFHKLADEWSIKYSYNTGFIRPTYEQGGGFEWDASQFNPEASYVKVFGADKGQYSTSNDIQIGYNDIDTYASLTLFKTKIDDFITWVGLSPSNTTRIWNANAGNIVSNGFEFEFKKQLSEILEIYGNYSYSKAKYNSLTQKVMNGSMIKDFTGSRFVTNDRIIADIPQKIWNLGVDIDLNKNMMLNVHYHGYSDVWVKWNNNPTYKNMGTFNFLDLNLNNTNVFYNGMELSFYVKNLLDNDDFLPGGDWGAYTEGIGRRYGFNIKYSF